jgi:Domain of unknown function (DUF4383)
MNRTPAQSAALLAGLVLVSLGILGFVPAISANRGSFAFAGHGSHTTLIGEFQISVLGNLVHILLGLAGIALAGTDAGARRYLTGGGAAFLVLWALGIANVGGWVPLNAADDWLHLGLGVALIGLGFAATAQSS